jgi:hypothetical protein
MRRARGTFGVVLAAVVAGGIALAAVACGNGANDVAGCQELENARCARAQECGLDLSYPLHPGSSAADAVTACQLFYQDACLHGFVTSITITSADLMGCETEIEKGDCNAVLNPEDTKACAWLNPPDAGADAGSDVSTTTADVAVVVTVDATVTVDTGVDAAADAFAACISQCEIDDSCSGEPDCVDMCESTCASGS